MKKIFSFLAVITLMMAAPNLVKAGDLSEILADGVIKIAVPESFAPFGSVGASGEHEGYQRQTVVLLLPTKTWIDIDTSS